MATTARERDSRHVQELTPRQSHGPGCGERMRRDATHHRTPGLLDGRPRIHRAIRRGHTVAWTAHLQPDRPEAEGRLALPRQSFGRDVPARRGARRDAERRTVPAIHHRRLPRVLSR